MIGMEHSLSPEKQEKLLVSSALRLDISASVFNRVAADLNQIEGNIYQGWLKYINELPPCVQCPITYNTWRERAITTLLTPES